ncbi:hypothetical protein JCM31271_17490 [Halorubrum trueperi]
MIQKDGDGIENSNDTIEVLLNLLVRDPPRVGHLDHVSTVFLQGDDVFLAVVQFHQIQLVLPGTHDPYALELFVEFFSKFTDVRTGVIRSVGIWCVRSCLGIDIPTRSVQFVGGDDVGTGARLSDILFAAFTYVLGVVFGWGFGGPWISGWILGRGRFSRLGLAGLIRW